MRQRGASLLEVVLATGIMATLSVGIFAMYRTQQQTFQTLMGEFKDPMQAAQATALISKELANARLIRSIATSSVQYRAISDPAPAPDRRIELTSVLVSPNSALEGPATCSLQIDMADGQGLRPFTTELLLRNHNPYLGRGIRSTLMLADGTTTSGAVPIFTYFDNTGTQMATPQVDTTGLGLPVRRVVVHLAVRGRRDDPPRYVRTSVTLRN